MTWVAPASKMLEWGFPMMSVDTNGSSEYSRIPRRSWSAAWRKAALTSSTVTSCSTSTNKSTVDPSGTGTRIAIPSSLPSN